MKVCRARGTIREREIDCRDGAIARIAYAAGTEVPEGVRAFLDCSSK